MATNWAIMPVLNNLEMTTQAIHDLLAQTGAGEGLRVLVINQGGSDELRSGLEALSERTHGRVLVWSHLPPLPSLSATWNRGLEFVWGCGGREALVVNNDVRLHTQTYALLSEVARESDALFVTAVGVREGQFDEYADHGDLDPERRGGPDFSCFLITKEAHRKYPFDEAFIPAYCEDLDAHRRYMLGGDGARIFSINVPYLHYASGTTKAFSLEERAAFAQRSQIARQHYRAKWGGEVNAERFAAPFSGVVVEGVTTPELQAKIQAGEEIHHGHREEA